MKGLLTSTNWDRIIWFIILILAIFSITIVAYAYVGPSGVQDAYGRFIQPAHPQPQNIAPPSTQPVIAIDSIDDLSGLPCTPYAETKDTVQVIYDETQASPDRSKGFVRVIYDTDGEIHILCKAVRLLADEAAEGEDPTADGDAALATGLAQRTPPITSYKRTLFSNTPPLRK